LGNATSLVNPIADQLDPALAAARPTFEQAGAQIEGVGQGLKNTVNSVGEGIEHQMDSSEDMLDAGAAALRDRLRARYPGMGFLQSPELNRVGLPIIRQPYAGQKPWLDRKLNTK
jgi:hypothetical protein